MQKSYEVMIETSQPPCGGKHPRLYEFLDIETDDPEAFVQEREPGVELEMSVDSNSGEITVLAISGKHNVRYVFTEYYKRREEKAV